MDFGRLIHKLIWSPCFGEGFVYPDNRFSFAGTSVFYLIPHITIFTKMRLKIFTELWPIKYL
jgi:hypothetical protein